MRYQRLQDIVRLAARLQGTLGGLTLDDIEADFAVSRRTAERLRDAVDAVFGPLELVDSADTKRHWRLRSDALRRLVSLSAEELAELDAAAETLERAGFEERAAALRELDAKLRATLRADTLARIESDLEALVHAEGLAMRAGPKPQLDRGLLALLREAITTRRVVEFHYLAQSTRRRSRQRVAPSGLLYGNRAFLVGRTDWSDEPRLWRLANMSEARITDDTFEPDPGFDLRRYAERSFGTFQEKPVQVVLHFNPAAARDASAFLFHPTQIIQDNPDGSLTVRFKAGGIDEMCWHLFTWGDSVTVEKPARLRRRLAEMCAALGVHHNQADWGAGTVCQEKRSREERRDSDPLEQCLVLNSNGDSGMPNVIYEGQATRGKQGNIKPHGHGKMEYLDGKHAGCRYEGEWSEGKYHGQGKLDTCDGYGRYQYEGSFRNGDLHGKGKYVYLDGEYEDYRYEGDFENDHEHGWGKWYRPDGSPDGTLEYEGEWSEGKYHGQGKLDTCDGYGRYQYEGSFRNGDLHGKGKYVYLDGEYEDYRYEGDFENDHEHGWGKWYRPDGSPDGTLEYEGEWSEGKYHGQGKLDTCDGYGRYQYEGSFRNGDLHGKGKYVYLDGEYEDYRYEGDFENGHEHGWGRWYRPDGSPDGTLEYEGEWSEGMYHGQGTEYCVDGTQRRGRWTYGELDDENAPPSG